MVARGRHVGIFGVPRKQPVTNAALQVQLCSLQLVVCLLQDASLQSFNLVVERPPNAGGFLESMHGFTL